jgi:hypothetical protein
MNNNEKECPCKSVDCKRHCNCDACREYHHSYGTATSCEKEQEEV